MTDIVHGIEYANSQVLDTGAALRAVAALASAPAGSPQALPELERNDLRALLDVLSGQLLVNSSQIELLLATATGKIYSGAPA